MIKEFIWKYKFYILAPFIIGILITIALIVLSAGPQKGPFIYQIH